MVFTYESVHKITFRINLIFKLLCGGILASALNLHNDVTSYLYIHLELVVDPGDTGVPT